MVVKRSIRFYRLLTFAACGKKKEDSAQVTENDGVEDVGATE